MKYFIAKNVKRGHKMSTITIIGLALWAVSLLLGTVTINNVKVNQLARVIIIIIALPFVGMLLTILGLIGLAILSPILHFFDWSWFIIPNL